MQQPDETPQLRAVAPPHVDINTDASIKEMVNEAAAFWDVESVDDFHLERAQVMLEQEVKKILDAQRQPWHKACFTDELMSNWIERAIITAVLPDARLEELVSL